MQGEKGYYRHGVFLRERRNGVVSMSYFSFTNDVELGFLFFTLSISLVLKIFILNLVDIHFDNILFVPITCLTIWSFRWRTAIPGTV